MQLQGVPSEYTANADKKFYARLPGEKTEIVAGIVPYSDQAMRGVEGLVSGYQEIIIMGVGSVDASQLMAEIQKRDARIQYLTTRLSEFERKRSFAPSGPNLPDDYYDNDIYLAE